MTKYSQKSPHDYAESAREVLCLCVAADRQAGMKTLFSLESQAEAFGMPKRRPRHLFERDRAPFTTKDEFARLLLLGADYLRQAADTFRARADRWDAEADELELKHKQLTLWDRGGEWTSHGGDMPQRKAA